MMRVLWWENTHGVKKLLKNHETLNNILSPTSTKIHTIVYRTHCAEYQVFCTSGESSAIAKLDASSIVHARVDRIECMQNISTYWLRHCACSYDCIVPHRVTCSVRAHLNLPEASSPLKYEKAVQSDAHCAHSWGTVPKYIILVPTSFNCRCRPPARQANEKYNKIPTRDKTDGATE